VIGLPTLATVPEVVQGWWCWGCGRRKVPKMALLPSGALRGGVTVRWTEYICDDGPDGTCLVALGVMWPDHPVVKPKRAKSESPDCG
jgi:hypothetical protein